MKYYTDGYLLLKNPSPLGGGYSIVGEMGNLIKRVEIDKVGLTNNEAEVMGIIATIELCEDNDSISSDSQTAISWVLNGLSKARPDLNDKLRTASFQMSLKSLSIVWEPRGKNLAGLYNEAFDTAIPEWKRKLL